jgi:hypothetical protein
MRGKRNPRSIETGESLWPDKGRSDQKEEADTGTIQLHRRILPLYDALSAYQGEFADTMSGMRNLTPARAIRLVIAIVVVNITVWGVVITGVVWLATQMKWGYLSGSAGLAEIHTSLVHGSCPLTAMVNFL